MCLLIFLVATVLYFVYDKASRNGTWSVTGPRGGSTIGLGYGVAGSLMILFAVALRLKKHFRTAHVLGSAYAWTKGHVWFGLLSYPIILYHGALHWGATLSLTWVLMLLFTIVIVTGLLGLFLQQYLPTKLLRDVQKETVYDQIDHVIVQLEDEARRLVDAAVSRKTQGAYDLEVVPAGGGVAVAAPPESAEGERLLQTFYVQQIAPYLAVNRVRRTAPVGRGFRLHRVPRPARRRPQRPARDGRRTPPDRGRAPPVRPPAPPPPHPPLVAPGPRPRLLRHGRPGDRPRDHGGAVHQAAVAVGGGRP